MSGSRPKPAARQLAEQHLGDRLSALVDGELGHDARERVLAHLATCAKCRTEVDAQRRLKNVFAEAAPPPPSESFLARLQGLPGGGDADGGGAPPLGTGFAGGRSGVFGVKRGEQFEFGYVPARPHPSDLDADRGLRIHHVGRPDNERSASRGLRFAFVAAGAVSLAAVALGGVTTGASGDTAADARGGSGTGSNVTPARTAGGGAAAGPEAARRRQSAAPLSLQRQRSSGTAPVAPTTLSAPLLSGVPSPAAGQGQGQDMLGPLTTHLRAGAAVMSPLIRPLTATPPISLTALPTAPGFTVPGLLLAPSPSASSRTAQ
ncbi:zf-HC2 domain-containing protein [Streptomyces sp. Li-HN-5-11]|uniref:anti-sigma factor family protein n=1 Tax=Streptomyces sp. Li-HN-5-11 TaxID=3075432 RepID=UPI0028ABC4C2|nr:zf-HC2 domain-containing protein [Streptomyces sp. Li-HN-5-11]WNM30066.1 zf-HC2 domain-containing protein [Streptomyces sp. Li-HN-5-11]